MLFCVNDVIWAQKKSINHSVSESSTSLHKWSDFTAADGGKCHKRTVNERAAAETPNCNMLNVFYSFKSPQIAFVITRRSSSPFYGVISTMWHVWNTLLFCAFKLWVSLLQVQPAPQCWSNMCVKWHPGLAEPHLSRNGCHKGLASGLPRSWSRFLKDLCCSVVLPAYAYKWKVNCVTWPINSCLFACPFALAQV